MKKIQAILCDIRSDANIQFDLLSDAELIHPIRDIHNGYLHELFPGLRDTEIALLVQSFNGTLPEELLNF